MNKQRLTTLANYLRTVPAERFGLGIWKCGAVACAIGHAARIPGFKKAGFRIVVDDEFGGQSHPEFQGAVAWGAVEAFFDLGTADSLNLFMEDYYPPRAGPNTVADRIEELVRGSK